jgi:hypothetical protein
MDTIVEIYNQLAYWVVGLAMGLGVLCFVTPALARILRLTPSHATRLRYWLGCSATILWYFFLTWGFGLAALTPAIPAVILTILFLQWLVPSSQTTSDQEHGGHPWWPSFAAMNWPLRLITATTIAQVVAAAAILWAFKVPTTPVEIGVLDGQSIKVDHLVILVASGFLAFGFGLLLAGASATAATRFIVIAIFALTARPATWVGFAPIIWLGLVGLLTLAGALAIVFRNAAAARLLKHHATFSLMLAAIFAAFYLSTAGAMEAGGANYSVWLSRQFAEIALFLAPVLFLAGTDFAEIGESLGQRVARLAEWTGGAWLAAFAAITVSGICAWTVWFIGALDTGGPWIFALAAGISAWVAFVLLFLRWVPERPRWLSGCLSAGLLMLALGPAFAVIIDYPWVIVVIIATVLVLIGAGTFISWAEVSLWSSARIPFVAIAILAISMAGTRELVSVFWSYYGVPPDAGPIHFVLQQNKDPTFSIAVPEAWVLDPQASGSDVSGGAFRFDAGDDYQRGALVLVATSRSVAAGEKVAGEKKPRKVEPETVVEYFWPELGPPRLRDGASYFGDNRVLWTTRFGEAFHKGRLFHIAVFMHQDEHYWWQIIGVCGDRYSRYFNSVFWTAVARWHPDLSAEVPPDVPAIELSRQVAQVRAFGFLPILYGLVGLYLIIRPNVVNLASHTLPNFSRKAPIFFKTTGKPIEVAALLAIFVAITAVYFLPGTELIRFWNPPAASQNPLALLQLTTAVLTVFAVLAALVFGRLRAWIGLLGELTALNLGILVLLIVYVVYGATIPLVQKALVAAGMLLATLLWDFLRSGQEITNVDGPVFRRPARILAYLGYIVLVGTTILFLSAQTVGGDKGTPEFLEAEDVVRQGIVWLGTPVLLLRFVLRCIARGNKETHAARPLPASLLASGKEAIT